jgi:hypothetical protein
MKPKAHAEMLAERIRTYWRARGAAPAVELVFVAAVTPTGDEDKRAGVWVIRSNMRNGMPRGFDPRRVRPHFLR